MGLRRIVYSRAIAMSSVNENIRERIDSALVVAQDLVVGSSSPFAGRVGIARSRRRWLRVAGWFGALLAVVAALTIASGWRAFGKRPSGNRRSRLERSPYWKNGKFENTEPMHNQLVRALFAFFGRSPFTTPSGAVPTAPVDRALLQTPPATGLRVTWFGHSTLLVELEGQRVLVDPLWSERIGPLTFAGPKRWYGPLLPIGELPAIDAVVISHDHYDHLDYPTIVAMKDWNTTFVVPLGVGAHLEYWGVSARKIVELDWWEHTRLGNLDLVATPARHISGRTLGIGDAGTLWSGWAILGRKRRVYYSGDTGLFPGMREIGERLGPFDVTLIESGEYGRYWSDWHLGPEQAVLAHRLVGGRVFIPIHWGLFTLAYHAWSEPAERAAAAAAKAGVAVLVPKPGQSIEPSAAPPFEKWWPSLPGKTPEEDPIVSSGTEGLSAGL